MIDRVADPGSGRLPTELLRIAALIFGSLVVAELLYRAVEAPFWNHGRRVSERLKARGQHDVLAASRRSRAGHA